MLGEEVETAVRQQLTSQATDPESSLAPFPIALAQPKRTHTFPPTSHSSPLYAHPAATTDWPVPFTREHSCLGPFPFCPRCLEPPYLTST